MHLESTKIRLAWRNGKANQITQKIKRRKMKKSHNSGKIHGKNRTFLTTEKRKGMLTAERAWSGLEIRVEGVSEKMSKCSKDGLKLLEQTTLLRENERTCNWEGVVRHRRPG